MQKRKKISFVILALVALMGLITPWSNSIAMVPSSEQTFPGLPDPEEENPKECEISGAVECWADEVNDECGVEPYSSTSILHKCVSNVDLSDGNSFFMQQVRVCWKSLDTKHPGPECTYLGPGECEFLSQWVPPAFFPIPVRFCARFDYKREDPNSSENVARLCVYEDPMDGGDTDKDVNLFHVNTYVGDSDKNVKAIQSTVGFVVLAQPTNPIALAAAAFLQLVALIMSYKNHVVTAEHGCVETPMAPGPYPCCEPPYQVVSAANIEAGGTFENPYVTLSFTTSSINISPGQRQSVTVEGKQRTFEVDYRDDKGDELCVMELNTTNASDFLGCVDRPDYMPFPIIRDGVTPTNPSIIVDFGNPPQQAQLYELSPPGPQTCKELYDVKFCAIRNEWGKMCLQGYEDDIVYLTNPNGTHLVNQLLGPLKDTDLEMADGDFTFHYETKNIGIVSIPNQPRVYRKTNGNVVLYSSINNGWVYNYDSQGEVTNPATPYFVPRIRAADELGLCIDVTTPESTFTVPGEYDVIIPSNCKTLEVEFWGAGGAGFNDDLEDKHADFVAVDDYSGGSGAYAKVKAKVNAGDTWKLGVGYGASSKGYCGGASYLKAPDGKKIAFADGGCGAKLLKSYWDPFSHQWKWVQSNNPVGGKAFLLEPNQEENDDGDMVNVSGHVAAPSIYQRTHVPWVDGNTGDGHHVLDVPANYNNPATIIESDNGTNGGKATSTENSMYNECKKRGGTKGGTSAESPNATSSQPVSYCNKHNDEWQDDGSLVPPTEKDRPHGSDYYPPSQSSLPFASGGCAVDRCYDSREVYSHNKKYYHDVQQKDQINFDSWGWSKGGHGKAKVLNCWPY